MGQTPRIWKRPTQTLPAVEDLQPLADATRTESRANLLGTPAPPDLTAPAPQLDDDPGKGENTIPDQEDGRNVDLTLTQPVTRVAKLGIPDPTEGAQPRPAAMPTTSTVPGGDTSSNLVPSRSNMPPGFSERAVTPNPNAALPVPPGIALGQPSIEALVADRSMAELAQSLAMAQAGGNPQAGVFSGLMTRLRQTCGLMTQGFEEVCLGVEVVVQKMLLEATATDRAFTTKAAKDLNL